MPARRVVQPAYEPLSPNVAKGQCRTSVTVEDTLLLGFIKAAREAIENETQLSLITQTWEYTRDYFESPAWRYGAQVYPTRPSVIELPRPPLQSVTWIQYLDGDGTTSYLYDSLGSPQNTTDVVVDTYSTPGRLLPINGGYWPAVLDQANAVTIRYVAGYGDNSEDVPAPLKQAILLLVGHLNENREAVTATGQITEIPMGVQWMINPYRVLTVR